MQALKRIFLILDKDRDGFLSPAEISNFQEECFKKQIDQQDMKELKEVILGMKDDFYGATRIQNENFTFLGFIVIMLTFLAKNKEEAVWIILKQYSYDEDCHLEVH